MAKQRCRVTFSLRHTAIQSQAYLAESSARLCETLVILAHGLTEVYGARGTLKPRSPDSWYSALCGGICGGELTLCPGGFPGDG